jgi:hypothetical protein
MLCLLTYAFDLYEIFLENAKELNLNHARLNFLRRNKLANHISTAILLKHSCCIELTQLGLATECLYLPTEFLSKFSLTSVHSY